MRRFALNSVGRWHGKLLLWALVCAVGFAGIPRLELHAHADASAGHQHVVHVDAVHDHVDPGNDASSPDAGTLSHDRDDAPSIPHAHDVSGLSHALEAIATPAVALPEPDPLIPAWLIERPTTWRTIPPHRPPIV